MKIIYDFKDPIEQPFTLGNIYIHTADTNKKEPPIYLCAEPDGITILINLNGVESIKQAKRKDWIDITHIYVLQAYAP